MLFGAIFLENGELKSGLFPLIDIVDMADGSLAVNDGAMSELVPGLYKYDYAGADDEKEYAAICDSVTLTGYERYAFGESGIEGVVNQAQGQVDGLHKLQGLDMANPMTVTPTSREVGTIKQTISGDGVATSTVERTA